MRPVVLGSASQPGLLLSPLPNESEYPRVQAGASEEKATNTTSIKRRQLMGLFKRNAWWWIDYYDAEGKRHRKKAAPDYQTAKLILRDTQTAIAKGEVLGVREEGLCFLDFVERRYWPTVAPTLSPHERARARVIFDNHLLPRFGRTRLVKLRPEEIERWQSERLSQASPATANKELMRLKHLLNRAVAWRYLKENPAKAVKKTREAPGRVRYLSPEEHAGLLDAASPALRLYILAALQTGARRGELANLRWADVDMKARAVTFRNTKNGDRRTVPMTETLRDALLALPRPLNPEAPVLPERKPDAITRAFGRLVKRLGLKDLRFHDLRHDVASTLAMAGVPQRAIMEILGHRDPRMTARYQHLAPGHLREAVQALDRARTEGVGGIQEASR